MATAPILLVQKHLQRLLPPPSLLSTHALLGFYGPGRGGVLHRWHSRCGSGLLGSGRVLGSTRARQGPSSPRAFQPLPSHVSGSGPGWPSGTGAPLSRAIGAVCQVSFSSPAPACAWPPGTHPAPNSDCSCTTSAFTPCHRGNHGPLLSDQHYLYVQAEPGHDCSGESRKEGGLGLLQRGWEVGCSLGMGQALADAPRVATSLTVELCFGAPQEQRPWLHTHTLPGLATERHLSPLEERGASGEVPFEAGIRTGGSPGPGPCPSCSESAALFGSDLAHCFVPDGSP